MSHEDDRCLPPPYSPTPASPPTQSRPPVQHSYSLHGSKNNPWATLTLASNVSDPRFLPAYYQGQTISGSVSLMLTKPESIHSISLILSGTITAASTPVPFTFWEVSRDLFNGADSNVDEDVQIKTARSQGNKSKGKLVGEHSWPFQIELPTSCMLTLSSKEVPASFPLPPSFSDKGAAQFINYDITVRIRKGSLRLDSRYAYLSFDSKAMLI